MLGSLLVIFCFIQGYSRLRHRSNKILHSPIAEQQLTYIAVQRTHKDLSDTTFEPSETLQSQTQRQPFFYTSKDLPFSLQDKVFEMDVPYGHQNYCRCSGAHPHLSCVREEDVGGVPGKWWICAGQADADDA